MKLAERLQLKSTPRLKFLHRPQFGIQRRN
ncbi:hypothetical protein GBAR_LOCUS3661 [Geodia barretti]|uniref:Uncharacterized protein n=1 Tax=Geodia barretti TaxID=519541 RepID=A0AA35R5W2_GEOBA|nr:hypothetical protein GBAR_LOCUS3661 [Geodia barretti]